MDFHNIVDRCKVPCAVAAAEITEDSRRGAMFVVCGNTMFRETMGSAFHDGVSTDELFPDESSFSDLCVRSAVMGQRVHSYAYSKTQDCWMDLTLFPLARESESMGHCLVFVEVSDTPNPDRMATVSMDTASAAVKASVALLGADDLKEGVRQILDDILIRSGGFSALLTLVDHERKKSVNFCEAFVKGFFADAELNAVDTPYEIAASWREMIGDGNEIVVEKAGDLDKLEPYNPAWVASLRGYGVNSLIITALRQGKSTIGYLLLSNFDAGRLLEVRELMELITFLLSAQIANYLLMERLERMSVVDELTHLLNRRAMMQRIHAIVEEDAHEPLGVINIDLNGLKEVNDREGHDAGDRLLMRASEVLREVFPEEDVFRMGGDEFVAITTDTDRESFEDKVESLRRDAAADRVSFAIGAHWSDGTEDINTAFHLADELMYADKSAFYKAHPEKNRRRASVSAN